jgi:putative oxidoreductase
MTQDHRIPTALLLLRLSVFFVMLIWVIDKFVRPDHAAVVFQSFYFIPGLGNTIIYFIGVIQLIIIVGFVLGWQKRFTYAAVLFFHSASTFSAFRQYLAPYEDVNILFFAAWPMLAACFTLYYLKSWDTKWVIDSPRLESRIN